jgi:hypothetical protein
MKSKFSRTVDFALSRIALWAAAFVWIRYYVDNVWVTLVAATAIMLFVNILLEIILKIKHKGKEIKSKELKRISEIGNQFLLNTRGQNVDFFAGLLKNENCAIIPTDDCIVAQKDAQIILICPDFSVQPLNKQAIVECVRYAISIKATQIAVFCLSYEKNIEQFCATLPDIKIKIYDHVKTYALLKTYDCFPEITRRLSAKQKMNLKQLFAYALNRSRAKGYMLSGLFLFAISLITFYRLYYLISASVLIGFGLLSYFNKRFNADTGKQLRLI